VYSFHFFIQVLQLQGNFVTDEVYVLLLTHYCACLSVGTMPWIGYDFILFIVFS